jgi:hypothetical protein
MAKQPAPTALDAPNKRQKTLEAVFVQFQIVAGSYERLLYGLNVEYLADQLSLSPIFFFPAHGTCLKSVSASPPAPGSSKRVRSAKSSLNNWSYTISFQGCLFRSFLRPCNGPISLCYANLVSRNEAALLLTFESFS